MGSEAAGGIGIQSGGWTIECQGKPDNITRGTTILEEFEAVFSQYPVVNFNLGGK